MYRKPVIYQLLPRLFGNTNPTCIPHGTLQENGSGKFADINTAALTAVRRLGVTHIWLTGILAHASATDYSACGIPPTDSSLVKGRAGSPYAVRDYYDVSPDLAVDVPRRMAECTDLIDRCHQSGLKVIVDFIPNHLSRQYASGAKPSGVADFGAKDHPQSAFSPQNNFYYLPGTSFVSPVAGRYREAPAKATGNDCFAPNPGICDWYETVKLNYGVDYAGGGTAHFDPVPDTWHKMLEILSFWAGKEIDGFRCDMAEMVPAAFWAWVIPRIKARRRHIVFIAEVYRPELYRAYVGSGFDCLYDKAGLYDTLRAVLRGERPAGDISSCWQHTGDLQPRMLHFLENHDEQRLASDFFLGDGFKALPALVVSSCLNTAPFMLYAGQEFGERGMDCEGFSGVDGRTSIFDYWSIGTLRRFNNGGRYNAARLAPLERRLYTLYTDLFGLIAAHPALATGATYDLAYANRHHPKFNPDKHFAFLRYVRGVEEALLLVAVNFGDQPAEAEVHIPSHAFSHLRIPEQSWAPGMLLFGTDADRQASWANAMPQEWRLNSQTPVPLALPAYGAGIYSFKKIMV